MSVFFLVSSKEEEEDEEEEEEEEAPVLYWSQVKRRPQFELKFLIRDP